MAWKVVPKAGHTSLELFDVGATIENAEIVEERGGVVTVRLPFFMDLAVALNAEMPVIRTTIQSPKRTERYVREMTYRRMLYSGSSPFRQIIDDEVNRSMSLRRVMGVDELAEKVASQTDEKVHRIKALIRKMVESAQLVIKDGKVYPGVKHPDIMVRREEPVMEFQPGKHPVKMMIFKYIYDVGRRRYEEIEGKLKRIKWIKRDSTLQRYLDEMVRDGCLRKVGDEYEALKEP